MTENHCDVSKMASLEISAPNTDTQHWTYVEMWIDQFPGLNICENNLIADI